MNRKIKGVFAMLASAFLFGVAPAIGRISYDGGSNGLMLALLRAGMALPVLFFLLRLQKIPLGLTRKNVADLALMGTLGSTGTTALLYYSMESIPVGLATVLNCTYPVFVVLYSMLVLRERASKATVTALIMTMVGVVMFSDYTGGGQLKGILAALASAVAFAFVMLYQYRSSLIELHPLKLSFWLCVVISICLLPFNLLMGRFTLDLTPKAWLCTFIASMLLSVAAHSLLNFGLPHIGSTTASILNMLEPITSVFTGVLLLGETVTLLKLTGCALILCAVTLLTLATKKRAVLEQEPEPDA